MPGGLGSGEALLLTCGPHVTVGWGWAGERKRFSSSSSYKATILSDRALPL